ncbi:MAG: hypothetical protein AAGE05_04345 [Pseudomonadota bacterium]
MQDYPILIFMLASSLVVCATCSVLIALKLYKAPAATGTPDTSIVRHLTKPSEVEIEEGYVYVTDHSGKLQTDSTMRLDHFMRTRHNFDLALKRFREKQAVAVLEIKSD